MSEENGHYTKVLASGGSQRFTPDMTDDQLRKLAREKLSEALQAIDPVSQPAMTQKLCAEVKDRLDGKPMQMVHQTGEQVVQPTIINITYMSAPNKEPAPQHMVIEHDHNVMDK